MSDLKVDAANTKDHWLELVEVEKQTDGSEDIWQRIIVRWDGCIHYTRFYNTPENTPNRDKKDGSDYLHICDLDELIQQLEKVKALAKQHFREWPL